MPNLITDPSGQKADTITVEEWEALLPVQALSGGNAALGWSATGLENGDTLTITTDGTYDFGATGPDLTVFGQFLDDSIGSELSSISGDATILSSTLKIAGDSNLPNGRGVVFGATETFAEDKNSTSSSSLRVSFPASGEFFLQYVTYYPQSAYDAAISAGALDSSAVWQQKQFWLMSGSDGYYQSDQTDILSLGYLWYNAGEYFSPTRVLTTNSVTGLNTDVNTPKPDFKDSRVPIIRQFRIRQGVSDVDATGGTVEYLEADGTSQILSNTWSNVHLISPGDVNGSVNHFNFPGYIRGFHETEGANTISSELYLTRGPSAAARVEIADTNSPTTKLRFSPCKITSWGSSSVSVEVNEGWWHESSLVGKYLHVYDGDNAFIGAVLI